jgi:WS/DGAT/MGAT family acyltransferase
MEQLSSIDATFIQAENPALPMHISSVSIYDPSTAPGGKVRFKDIIQLYEDAIYEVPLLRRRLVEVPGNMDFPFWREDPDFDVEFHVRHIALPKPGDWRQFYIQLARLHSRQLDMQRPLWEVYVIEGLNDLDGIPSGSFAIVQKVHHAALDGVSALRLFNFLNKASADEPWRLDSRGRALLLERQPDSLPLLWAATRRYLGRPRKMLGAAKMALDALRRVKAAEKAGEITEAVEAPPSRFNQETSPHRVVTSVDFDLSEFVQLRKAHPGATVNDVALTVCGGALRRYLQAKDESVSPSLVAQVPVDIRDPGAQQADGNQIETIACACGTDIEHPLERLAAVQRSTVEGKKRLKAMGTTLTVETAEAMGPHITKALYHLLFNPSRLGPLGRLLPGGPNLIFSNMVGPRDPVYLCGAELKWGSGLGPVMPNAGLFVTANSTLDRFIFGIAACRRMLPDPDFFNTCLRESYREVRDTLQPLAARETGAANAPRRKTRARKPASARRKSTRAQRA